MTLFIQNPDSDKDAVEALLALGGMVCTGCGQELDARRREYHCACCDLAHCPYCYRSMKDRCAHRIAHREWSRWHFRKVAGPTLDVPFAPLAPTMLLDYTDAQKEIAFGCALPLLALYGQGYADRPTASVLTEALIQQFGQFGSEQSVGGARAGKYFFARDPEHSRGTAKAALRALRDGFERLARVMPPSAPYLHRVLSPPSGCKAEKFAAFLHFAPGGAAYVARNYGSEVVVWNRNTDAPVRFCCGGNTVVGAHFSPDGTRLAVHTQRTIDWRDTRCTVSLWDLPTGRLLLKQETAAPPQPGRGENGLHGFLHAGETLAVLRDNTVHLVPVGTSTVPLVSQAECLPGVCLRHRVTVDQMAVAPDGTLATTQGDHVLLWRISKSAVRGEDDGKT